MKQSEFHLLPWAVHDPSTRKIYQRTKTRAEARRFRRGLGPIRDHFRVDRVEHTGAR